MANAHKYVYLFSEGNGSMRELLGGKGANLAEMNLIGIPVPPGFTITTDVCTEYYAHGKDKVIELLRPEVERAVNAANEGVSRAESIRKFEILPDEFTQDNGMLTASLKTRRAQIVAHYRELIDTVIYVPKKK